MTNNTRYWNRVGMYVTREFAEEWIEKMGQGDSTRGKMLDEDIEEYVVPIGPSATSLRDEIEEIFSKPFEEVELPSSTQAILAVAELERNKVKRIKALKAEGYDLQEAKDKVQSEINLKVAEIMGIDIDDYEERQEQYAQPMGDEVEVTEQEASTNEQQQ